MGVASGWGQPWGHGGGIRMGTLIGTWWWHWDGDSHGDMGVASEWGHWGWHWDGDMGVAWGWEQPRAHGVGIGIGTRWWHWDGDSYGGGIRMGTVIRT